MMSENNSELWNLFPELLNCFYFFLFFPSHILCGIIYLVFKMRFERPTFCICRGTFCIQVSCSKDSAISPTENLSTSYYTTPKIDHNFFFLKKDFFTVNLHCQLPSLFCGASIELVHPIKSLKSSWEWIF